MALAVPLSLLSLALTLGCSDGADAGSAADAAASTAAAAPPAPVKVAPIERRAMTLRRTFSGTLEPSTRVQVAARVGGRLARVAVDLGDEVAYGQVVAAIDPAELDQALISAQADLAVAKASVAEAEAAAEFANRALERLEALDVDGVASKAELDSARAQASARRASVTVANARVQRAEASLGVAGLQRSEADVLALWNTTDPSPLGAQQESLPIRAVSRRFVDEGELVSPGTPLVEIVGLQPIVAVVFVPERDYARLSTEVPATLATDAYPGETFSARVARVAPVFSRNTRQVRVELVVENASLRLKPGMFVRATILLERVDECLAVPYEALAKRGSDDGLFVLSKPSGAANEIRTVRWVPVTPGIREGTLVQITGAGTDAGLDVVVLGQALCDDGARVTVPDEARTP